MPLDLAHFQSKYGQTHVLLVRAHYFIANALDLSAYPDFVIDVGSHDDINDLYLISDILITDYSSVFFDYALLKRPILFYMPDLTAYRDEVRDFYLDLEVLPGPIVTNQADLEAALDHIIAGAPLDSRFADFLAHFAPYEDGHASERVLEQLFP